MHKLQFLPSADQPIGVDEATSHRLGVEDHVPGHAHQNVPVVPRVGEAAHCNAGERKEVTVCPSGEQKRRRDGRANRSAALSLSLCGMDRSTPPLTPTAPLSGGRHTPIQMETGADPRTRGFWEAPIRHTGLRPGSHTSHTSTHTRLLHTLTSSDALLQPAAACWKCRSTWLSPACGALYWRRETVPSHGSTSRR